MTIDSERMTYPATRYLRQLTPANGWRAELVRDTHGRVDVVVAVRVGPVWSDSSPSQARTG